jgi:membrane protease subunit (stomatin/prohibitin family)
MPILFAGAVCCQFGFMGRVSRYVAGEVAPVQKDTFNYLAEGTQQGVRTLAGAVRDGLAAGKSAAAECSKCHAANEPDAKFCAHCGAELQRERSCPACNAVNAADAQFCNQCGGPLSG